MEKNRLEMKRLSEENRIQVAEAKIVQTEYLEEAEKDQHLELLSLVDCTKRVNDWVHHALEKQIEPDIVPFPLKFAT